MHKTKALNVDMILSLTEKDVKDWIEKEVGDAPALLAVVNLTGMEGKGNGVHKLIAQREIVHQLQDTYEKAIEKIRSEEYNQEELTYPQNVFDMLKEATKTVCETYRDMCTDPGKQIWLNDQIENLERMSMRSYSPYTFEAY